MYYWFAFSLALLCVPRNTAAFPHRYKGSGVRIWIATTRHSPVNEKCDIIVFALHNHERKAPENFRKPTFLAHQFQWDVVFGKEPLQSLVPTFRSQLQFSECNSWIGAGSLRM